MSDLEVNFEVENPGADGHQGVQEVNSTELIYTSADNGKTDGNQIVHEVGDSELISASVDNDESDCHGSVQEVGNSELLSVSVKNCEANHHQIVQEVGDGEDLRDSVVSGKTRFQESDDTQMTSRLSRGNEEQNRLNRQSSQSTISNESLSTAGGEDNVPEDQTSLLQSTQQQHYLTFPRFIYNEENSPSDQRGCCGVSFIMLRVYTSHGLSSWGDRMWTFAVGLFLIILYPSSLQLSASYGLSTSLSVILFGELIGRWIDKTARLKAACIALVIQNGSIAICAILVVLCFQYQDAVGGYMGLMYASVIVMAVVAHLSSVAQKITMEKDWIVVIADNDNDKLAAMNAVFRTLDLSTFTLAPVLVGQLMTFTSASITAVVIAVWSLISLVVEYGLLHNIYKVLPNLARKEATDTQASRTLAESFKHYISGWKTFFKQEGWLAGLGLACLYMTVLGFDSITVGYSYSQGVSESIIGVLISVSAVVGIMGSISYPFIRSRIGLERTGLAGFFSLILSLSLCVASVFTAGSPFDVTSLKNIGNFNSPGNSSDVSPDGNLHHPVSSYLSISLLLSGVVLARFGLWVADLSITQIVQQVVVQGERGVVGGIQNSLNMMMNSLKSVLVILVPLPQQFGFLILISFGFICLGWLFYALHSRSKRGHILPFQEKVQAWRDQRKRKQAPEEIS